VLRVQTGRLFLHATGWVHQDEGRIAIARVESVGEMEVTGHRDVAVQKANVLRLFHFSTRFGARVHGCAPIGERR